MGILMRHRRSARRALASSAALAFAAGCGGPGDDAERAGSLVIEDGYVEVEPGLRLYYKKVGDGPQTVVIPGGFYLEDQFDGVTHGRTLLFYDMRDRGRSDSVADMSRAGIQQDIDDLEALRAHFELETMNLVGWSYLGAMVALYAFEHPDRVERIVQIGPIPPRSSAPYSGAAVQAYWEALDSAGVRHLDELEAAGVKEEDPIRYYEEYWRVSKPALFGDPARAAWYEMPPADLANEWLHNLELHFQAKFESFGEHDHREAAAAWTKPVLTIHGTLDRNAPFEGGREWSAAFADGRFLAVEGSAHMPMVEQPALIRTALDVFLRGYWPEGSVVIEIDD